MSLEELTPSHKALDILGCRGARKIARERETLSDALSGGWWMKEKKERGEEKAGGRERKEAGRIVVSVH